MFNLSKHSFGSKKNLHLLFKLELTLGTTVMDQNDHEFEYK